MVKDNQRKPLVSIAILTWNRCQFVLRALESVHRQSYGPIEVVVVDSASIDDTVDMIKRNFSKVKVIELHRNMGCPEGRNIAIANCAGDIIFSLDDDAWLAAETIELCVNKFNMEPDLGVIACQVLSPEEMKPSKRNNNYTYIFSGGASVFRKEIFEKSGYYPSDFYRQAEEGDLALRIIDSGYKIMNFPDAIVYHEPAHANKNTKLFMFYGCRNELFTIIRRYPLVLIPLAFCWKFIIWNLAGIRKNALHYTVGACLVAFLKLPMLIYKREPVSFSAVKELLALKVFKEVPSNK